MRSRSTKQLSTVIGRTTAVIPCYKDDRFLSEAIASVVHQTAPVARLVVVDDGSPEPLLKPDIADAVSDLVWIRTPNHGLGAARNEGLRHATGEFVAFLDADDHWHPEKIELQQRHLDQFPNSVACYTHCVDSPGYFPFGPYPALDLEKTSLAAMVWQEQFFPPSSMMARRDTCVDVGGFREKLHNGEDLDFLFRLFKHGNVTGVDKALTFYRVHNNQITSDPVRKVMGSKEARRGVIQHSGELLSDAGIPKDNQWDAYRNAVLLSFFKRDFKSARVMLIDYWREHPSDFKILLYILISCLPSQLVTQLRGRV